MASRPGLRFLATSPAWRRGRWVTTSTGQASLEEERESGKLIVRPDEAVLFFDNIFPLKLSFLIGRRSEANHRLTELLRRYNSSTLGPLEPIQLVRRAIPQSLPIKVTQIVPRLQDGGAYVKFSHDEAVKPGDVEATLRRELREAPVTPWFNPFRGVRARLVRGTPWLEDLYRYPTSLLLVEFLPPTPGTAPEEIPEEAVYNLFRSYGRIADIVAQPSDSKTTPRYVHLSFSLVRDAVMARSCMHGYVLDEARGGGKSGTKLKLSYVRRARPHGAWSWMTSHPRIVIPVVAALLAGFSVFVFDPIRQFFVRLHVQRSLRFENWKIYRWLKAHTSLFLGPTKKKIMHADTVWTHHRDLIEQLQSWLDGSSGTFIVVTGPRGSAKTEMVMDQALAGRRNVLYMDCKRIAEGGADTGIINRLAAAVGYRPVFSWANGISSMIDLALQSTAGVKTGFTETLDSQIQQILNTTLQAVKRIALSGRTKQDKDANLSEDAYLEAHPEGRPVIVIDNYLYKNEETVLVYEKLAEWAASLVQNNVAHVVFLTNSSSYTKTLSKALPDSIFRTLSFSDLDQDLARNFVISRLEELWKREDQDMKEEEARPTKRPDLSGLDACIQQLGGRLTDLEFLARRLKAGQNPKEATEEIVNENATDIVKMYLLGSGKKWTTQQAWGVIKGLASADALRYNQLLLHPTFSSSGAAAIDSLAGTELISVTSHRGRPQSIKPGRPLHQASFKVLLRDRVLRARMDLSVLEEMAKLEAGKMAAVEAELKLLGGLPRGAAAAGRGMYLLEKVAEGQRKIDEWEGEMGALKKVLDEEF